MNWRVVGVAALLVTGCTGAQAEPGAAPPAVPVPATQPPAMAASGPSVASICDRVTVLLLTSATMGSRSSDQVIELARSLDTLVADAARVPSPRVGGCLRRLTDLPPEVLDLAARAP